MLKEELDGLQGNFPDRLRIAYFLSNPGEGSGWANNASLEIKKKQVLNLFVCLFACLLLHVYLYVYIERNNELWYLISALMYIYYYINKYISIHAVQLFLLVHYFS